MSEEEEKKIQKRCREAAGLGDDEDEHIGPRLKKSVKNLRVSVDYYHTEDPYDALLIIFTSCARTLLCRDCPPGVTWGRLKVQKTRHCEKN